MPIPPEQLAQLIDRHWAPLVAWVGNHHGNAEDVIQQAFIKLAAAEPTPDCPVAWLYTVSRREAINERQSRLRRIKRQRKAAKHEQVVMNVERTAEADELLEKLQQLTDTQREIVVAKVWGGFNFKEIAKLVDSSQSTVWRQYEAAISTLRNSYGVVCKSKT